MEDVSNDPAATQIRFRIFDENGNARAGTTAFDQTLASEFALAGGETAFERLPFIQPLEDSDFVIGYSSYADNAQTMGTLFASTINGSDGQQLADRVVVGGTGGGRRFFTDVLEDEDGDVVFLWTQNQFGNFEGDNLTVVASELNVAATEPLVIDSANAIYRTSRELGGTLNGTAADSAIVISANAVELNLLAGANVLGLGTGSDVANPLIDITGSDFRLATEAGTLIAVAATSTQLAIGGSANADQVLINGSPDRQCRSRRR